MVAGWVVVARLVVLACVVLACVVLACVVLACVVLACVVLEDVGGGFDGPIALTAAGRYSRGNDRPIRLSNTCTPELVKALRNCAGVADA